MIIAFFRYFILQNLIFWQFLIFRLFVPKVMDIMNTYKAYRQFIPEYVTWRDEQDLKNAKKLEYLKQHPENLKEEDIQRGKRILYAIDIMDEYSQSNAEDTEVATQMASGQVVGLATMAGVVLGGPILFMKSFQNMLEKVSKKNKALGLFLGAAPTVLGMLLGTIASFPAIVLSTKAKVGASRRGRFESMDKDLKNPAIFAVLTPEQQKQVDEISKDIVLEDKDKKRIDKKKGMNLNPLESFKTLKTLYSGNDEYKKAKLEFDKILNTDESKFDVKLTEKQIADAKRDQQILSNMVRKIDIASQDYAENVELATNTIVTMALGTGGLVGWVANKIMKSLKVQGGVFAKFIPWAVGLTIPLVMGGYAAKIQKQASRIARFKVKQELQNNPAEFVYINDKDLEDVQGVKLPQKTKKPNVFKFFVQLIKDNKKYQNYVKTESVEQLKRHKAIEKIELSEEQMIQAKNLQKNLFKTFNKVDEKSQTYSESVEAMGQLVMQGASTAGSLLAMGISYSMLGKMMSNPKFTDSSVMKVVTKAMLPFVFFMLPLILIDIFTTKAQKKASRVADMLALKELEDYRHYVDYSQIVEPKPLESAKTFNSETNLIKRFQAN